MTTNNGSLSINGSEIKVYDDTDIQKSLSNKADVNHTHTFSDITDVDISTILPNEGDFLKFQNGKWKPSSMVSQGTNSINSYVLELTKWGVSNIVSDFGDVSLSANNSNGINNAIQWASQQGYTELIFPKGIYLINESLPIQPSSFMILNLNGATLRIRDNGLASYSVISFKQNQVFSRVTNGIIQGDRYDHDYTTPGQAVTHEWGMGVLFPNTADMTKGEGVNTRFITIDNIEFLDLTGDGVSLFSTQGLVYATTSPTKTYSITFEQGSINTNDGSLITDSNKIRSNIFLDLTNQYIVKYKTFGIYGDVSYNSVGSEIDNTMPFDIIFYNQDGSFNSSLTNVEFYDEIFLPSGAINAKIVLHQSNIPSSSGNGLTLRCITIPKFTYVEKCHVHNTRRLGVALQGAKWIWVRNNDIHHISGANPQAALDIEDNYALNQNVYIEDNYLHDNKLQLIFVKGKNFQVRNNKIERGIGITSNSGVKKVLINGNYFKDTGIRLDGEGIIANNQFHRGTVLLTNYTTDPVTIDNNIFTNSLLTISRDKSYSIMINNCRFTVDNDFNYQSSSVGFTASSAPQTMSNCSFEGYVSSSSSIFSGNPNATEGWSFNNLLFINNKKTVNNASALSLPRGTYTNCRFNNPGSLSTAGRVEFIGCTFTWDGYNLFGYSYSELIKYNNCTFRGGSYTAFYFASMTQGRFEVINSLFEYPNATSNSQGIVSGYWGNVSGGSFVFDGNRFTSNIPMKVIDASTITNDAFNIVFKNNILEGGLTYSVDQTQLQNFHNNNINGTIDPYNWATSAPITGFYKLGKQLMNTNMLTSGYMGWICVKEGFLDTYNTWSANTNYTLNNRITMNGYVYYCANRLGGTSGASQPTFPTIIGATVADNNITWKCIGQSGAIFKQFGALV